MRDPARIAPMLEALRRAWEKCPDLRLGQIVSNAARQHPAWPDVFSVEDDVILRGLTERDSSAPRGSVAPDQKEPPCDPAP